MDTGNLPPSRSPPDTAGTDPTNSTEAEADLAQRLDRIAPYDPSQPDQGRSSIRLALNAAILFILDLFPTEAKAVLPLQDLLCALSDLEHGRPAPLFHYEKPQHHPGLRLSEQFLRALAAAAMTKAMEAMNLEAASRYVANRLTAMGYPSKGKPIGLQQVSKWREAQTAHFRVWREAKTENFREETLPPYGQALAWTEGLGPLEAADYLLDLLPHLHPQKPGVASTATAGAPARREVDLAALERARSFLVQTLRLGHTYDPSQPDHGRLTIRAQLSGVIGYIAELFQNKPSVLLPLRQLLFALRDLDLSKPSPIFEHVKVPHGPGLGLSEEQFRAIAAAALTRNMEVMERKPAARDIARRLHGMGYRNLHTRERTIDWKQVVDWRENIMSRKPREPMAVTTYRQALAWVEAWELSVAVDFLLKALPGVRAPDVPKKPRSQ